MVVDPFLLANISSLASRSSGASTPFVVAILVKIAAASLVLDLQTSHLGDSGISFQETKKTKRGITETILMNLQDAKSHPDALEGMIEVRISISPRSGHNISPIDQAATAMPMMSSLRRDYIKDSKTAAVVFHLLRFGQSSHMRFKAMSNKGSIPIFPKTCKYFERG